MLVIVLHVAYNIDENCDDLYSRSNFNIYFCHSSLDKNNVYSDYAPYEDYVPYVAEYMVYTAKAGMHVCNHIFERIPDTFK